VRWLKAVVVTDGVYQCVVVEQNTPTETDDAPDLATCHKAVNRSRAGPEKLRDFWHVQKADGAAVMLCERSG
jgi:hypothetical protein